MLTSMEIYRFGGLVDRGTDTNRRTTYGRRRRSGRQAGKLG